MKVTYVDEIETHWAWLKNMYCPKCVCGKYNIHHQLQPETTDSWWIECPACGHETLPQPSRKLAIESWQHENEI